MLGPEHIREKRLVKRVPFQVFAVDVMFTRSLYETTRQRRFCKFHYARGAYKWLAPNTHAFVIVANYRARFRIKTSTGVALLFSVTSCLHVYTYVYMYKCVRRVKDEENNNNKKKQKKTLLTRKGKHDIIYTSRGTARR